MSDRAKSVFAEVLGLPITSISDDTSPDNTREWDSVKAIDLALAIEEEFAVRFTTKEIVSMRTVGIVKKVLQAKGIADV